MKILLTVLFFCMINLGHSNGLNIDDKTYPVEKIEVTNLNKFQGKYITLYLVIGRKILSPEPTISRVVQVLGSQEISENSVIFANLEVVNDEENVILPNYVIAVIHNTPDHALNKFPVTNGKSFAAPEYVNEADMVVKTKENSIEVARRSYSILSLPDITLGLSIDFSK